MGFAMALSEACQNIVEHAARAAGWRCRRTTAPQAREAVVVIAVADAA